MNGEQYTRDIALGILRDYMCTLQYFDTDQPPRPVKFKSEYYAPSVNPKTPDKSTFGVQVSGNRVRITNMFDTFSLSRGGPFAYFDAVPVPINTPREWSTRLDDDHRYIVYAFPLPPTGVPYMITERLSGCLFLVAENQGALYACHIQPGASVETGIDLYEQFETGRFAVTVEGGTMLPRETWRAVVSAGGATGTHNDVNIINYGTDDVCTVIGYKAGGGWRIVYQVVDPNGQYAVRRTGFVYPAD